MPAGGTIATENAQELEALAPGEIEGGKLKESVYLVSKAYLLERDERELGQLKLIEKLKLKAGIP